MITIDLLKNHPQAILALAKIWLEVLGKTWMPHVSIAEITLLKHGEPALDLFLFAAEQMGYKLEDCLVIEDSIASIQAAQAAQMPAIGFLSGSHANFDWYKERILDQRVPVTHYTHEVLGFITNFNFIGALVIKTKAPWRKYISEKLYE